MSRRTMPTRGLSVGIQGTVGAACATDAAQDGQHQCFESARDAGSEPPPPTERGAGAPPSSSQAWTCSAVRISRPSAAPDAPAEIGWTDLRHCRFIQPRRRCQPDSTALLLMIHLLPEFCSLGEVERAFRAAAYASATSAGKKAATEKRDAAYAGAKEKCGSLADDAKATCIKEAKVRHGQS